MSLEYSDDNEIIRHSGSDLKEVMASIFEQYPEESFYFLNEKKLRENAAIFQAEFLPDDSRSSIAYAVKANPHPEVLRILTEAGITDFDCASEGEIARVKSENPNALIYFNNPHKKHREIRNAVFMEVEHFTADVKGEVDKILKEAGHINPEIAIRLKTLNAEGAMINLSEKFGASEDRVKKLLKYVEQQGAIPCISMNVGSQVVDLSSYEKNWDRLLKVVKESVGKVLTINFGGGIPVLQDNTQLENDLLLVKYLEKLSQVVRLKIGDVLKDSEDAKIIIEPGRSMVASAVDLAVAIINVQENGQRSLTIDDGIFTSFGDSVIHNWPYKMNGIDASGDEIERERQNYVLYGRTCDSGDVIPSQSLPKGLTEKDYIHVPNAGAYLSSQSTEFNSYPVHRYVVYNS